MFLYFQVLVGVDVIGAGSRQPGQGVCNGVGLGVTA
jgi:hypothetical protein